jgi:hypothetical protein
MQTISSRPRRRGIGSFKNLRKISSRFSSTALLSYGDTAHARGARERKEDIVKLTSPAAALAAGLLLGSAPAFAATDQSQAGPIHIDAVFVYPGSSSAYDGIFIPGSLQITFVSDHSAPATAVVFAFTSHGFVVDRFDDVGSFAKGVTINHSIPYDNGERVERVAVEKATFADGTVWNNPAVAGPAVPAVGVGIKVTKPF